MVYTSLELAVVLDFYSVTNISDTRIARYSYTDIMFSIIYLNSL